MGKKTRIFILFILLVSQQSIVMAQFKGRISFYSAMGNKDAIYVVEDGNSNPQLLIPDAQCPAFSPDGTRIAFQRNRGSNKDIYIINTDGSNVHRLTDSPSCERHAAWSPDGTQIAFQSDRDGNPEIYIISVEGGDWHRVTNNSAIDMRPTEGSSDALAISWVCFSSAAKSIILALSTKRCSFSPAFDHDDNTFLSSWLSLI